MSKKRVKKVPVTPEIAELLEAQVERFRQKFGRDPRPGEPLFFDEDADAPQPWSPEKADEVWSRMCDELERAGADPAYVHACRKTKRIVAEVNIKLLDQDELREWLDAIREGERIQGARH